ncbi:hypothetical protein EUX98_g6773 [Antrodiella citrinella]|uniref:Translocon-associated protein subunit alpha n=1 Tax=Antrodiella citrinella TaxID=2447956 RepID=A0A4S4MVM7_9APHY|nr:hypothetical protein EUX98_g6773 [Antrodiella citrinella]
MRFQTLLGYGAGFAALWSLIGAVAYATEPEVLAVASFAEANVFGHVVNGESNKLVVLVENKSDRDITLENIAGSFHSTEGNKLVKNITAQALKLPLIQGAKLSLPYAVHSEFKPGDVRLNLWLEHTADGQKYRVTAYDSVVTVVEPEGSIFDIKLWITYLIVLGLVGAAGYYTYLTLFPEQAKKIRKAPAVSAPVGPVTATGAGGYQEEWIPEHHLKKPKAKKTKSGTAATSGEETSGAELSGAEGRKRKGKK